MKPSLKNKRIFCLTLIIILVFVNLSLSWLPFRVRYPDVSGSNTYQLSDAAKRYLETVDQPVTLTYSVKGGVQKVDKDLYGFLLQFTDANPMIKVVCKDTTGLEGATENSISIQTAKGKKTFLRSELFYYQSQITGESLSMQEYSNILAEMQATTDANTYQSYLQSYGPGTLIAAFTGEANLTSAIRFLSTPEALPKICTYSTSSLDMHLLLRQQLEQTGYTVVQLSDVLQLPDDCAALYLIVEKDLTPEQAGTVAGYLSTGGKVFLTTTCSNMTLPNLSTVLKEYGLALPEKSHVILYPDTDSSSIMPVFNAVIGDHPATDRISQFAGYLTHAIQTADEANMPQGVVQTVLLKSPSTSFMQYLSDQQAQPIYGSYSIGMLAEKGDSALAWISMPIDSVSNGISGGSNYQLVKNLFGHMTGNTQASLSLSHTAIPSTYFAATTSHLIWWVLILVLALPAGLITVGTIHRYARRKAK